METGTWGKGNKCFSICWTNLMLYAFSPFSILGIVLAKVQQDGATGMLVTPLWSTQPWFPQLLGMVAEHAHIPSTAIQVHIGVAMLGR